MRSDELRDVLRDMADEMAPFEGDLLSLHRRERRRHIVFRVAAVVVALVLVAGIFAATRDRGGKRVEVEQSPKELLSRDLRRIDLLVVPATLRVKHILDASALVAHYTRVAPNTYKTAPKDIRCATEHDASYAVESAVTRDIEADLARELGRDAKVFDLSHGDSADLEVFMKTDAAPQQTQAARAAISQTAGIQSVRFLDHNDAYAEFKQIFVDQPALVAATSPDVLPESFRIVVDPAASLPALETRFERLPGVDTVVSRASGALPPNYGAVGADPTDACTP